MDRESIVRELETLYAMYADAEVVERHEYGNTPSADIFHNRSILVHNAVTLLKAQEPIAPTVEHDEYPDGTPKGFDLYYCAVCGDDIADGQKYCSNCGRSVKWG